MRQSKTPLKVVSAKQENRLSSHWAMSAKNAKDNPLAPRAGPFFKGESGSPRIAAEAALRPALGVQPSASGTTVVHLAGEPLGDEGTAAENANQQKEVD